MFQEAALERDLSIKANVPHPLPEFSGDRDRIMQVFMNLVDNAIKYSPKHTEIEIGAIKNETELIVSITDQGHGVPADKQKLIFQKFAQLEHPDDQVDRGLGLGLSIAQEIVQSYGGRLWLKSRSDKGSTFYFAIPLPEFDEPKIVTDVTAPYLPVKTVSTVES